MLSDAGYAQVSDARRVRKVRSGSGVPYHAGQTRGATPIHAIIAAIAAR